jgi:hypothetical protein
MGSAIYGPGSKSIAPAMLIDAMKATITVKIMICIFRVIIKIFLLDNLVDIFIPLIKTSKV